jgi:hypothetical protein
MTIAALVAACATPSGTSSSLPSATGSPSAGESAAGSTGPGPSPATGLRHFLFNRIGLDYPADWSERSYAGQVPVFGGLIFLGTAPSTGGCTSTGPNSNTCGPDFHLAPGTVSVAVYWQDGPMVIDPFAVVADPGPGTRVFVDGVPAILTETSPSRLSGADHEIALELLQPGLTAPPVFILAEIDGPNADGLLTQGRSLITSVHYEPALQPTLSLGQAAGDAAVAAAARTMAVDAGDSSLLACLASPRGPASAAMLTGFPHGPVLTKPLPITCSTTIEGTALEFWKVALTFSWTAGTDRAAGSATMRYLVGLDGTTFPYGPEGDAIPYQP